MRGDERVDATRQRKFEAVMTDSALWMRGRKRSWMSQSRKQEVEGESLPMRREVGRERADMGKGERRKRRRRGEGMILL